MTKTEITVMNLMETTARACGVGAGFPRNATSYLGHVDFWASHVTTGKGADLLRCLAALGVSRDPWRHAETNTGMIRRATLRDVSGAARGEVILSDEGGSASLDYGLHRPLECFEIAA